MKSRIICNTVIFLLCLTVGALLVEVTSIKEQLYTNTFVSADALDIAEDHSH